MDKVVVPLINIMGYEDKEDYKEESVASLRLHYKLIQAAKRMRSDAIFSDEQGTVFNNDLMVIDSTKTMDDIIEEVLQKRCDEMRPESSWDEVAESLGMARKTLSQKRKYYGVYDPTQNPL